MILGSDRGTITLLLEGRGPVVLRYVEAEGGELFVFPSSSSALWSAEVLRAGGCRVALSDGHEREYATSLVTDPAKAESLREAFLAKYGASMWRRYFGRSSKVMALDPAGRVRPRTDAELLRQEFDAAAPGYAASVEAQPVERYLKGRTADRLKNLFAGIDPLLEIGPGIGVETLPILLAGHRVTAVDLSERMLEELRGRAMKAGVNDRLETRVGRLSVLDEILSAEPAGRFGGAYSTFGAFNLEPDTSRVRSSLARLIRPRGILALTTLNRPGIIPLGWELALGRPRAAGARLRPKVPAERIRYPLDVYLRRPSEWDRWLAPEFHRVGSEAVSILAPPFGDFRPLTALGPRAWNRIARFDRWLARRPGLADVGEWAFLTYERSASAG
jgi:SAM-dependent methyltransferase